MVVSRVPSSPNSNPVVPWLAWVFLMPLISIIIITITINDGAAANALTARQKS